MTSFRVITFRKVSVTASIVSFLLFLTLLLAPQLIFSLFDIEGNPTASFLARRAAILLLGYAVITYLARNTEPSTARQAVSLGLGCTWLSLMVLGAIELLRGFVGFGSLLAMGVELFLGLGYLFLWASNRRKSLVQTGETP